jgi:glucose/arabinose dehydrogenase
MSPVRSTILMVTVLVAAGGCDGEGFPSGTGINRPDPEIALQLVEAGFQSPVHIVSPPGDDRLFVVEQRGVIWILRDDVRLAQSFLDIQGRVNAGAERGLLGLAFHPSYATNGRFYVDYTNTAGNTVIEEYLARTDNTDRADATSGRILLSVVQPASNHNGGLLQFGPDGYLWIGMGDGGGSGDTYGNGQDPGTLLGAMLRIDVDGGDPYGIPADNPFADGVGGAPEVWAYGLRNPWRWSFDAATGTVWIADVGQGQWEEVDGEPVGDAGLNYGWPVMEGDHCFSSPGCDTDGLVRPVYEYDHGQGCSITGGFVYRGSAMPDMVGRYVFGDFCQGWIRSFDTADGAASDVVEHDVDPGGTILSFGRDADGEIYVLTGHGTVYRIVDGS